MTNVHGIERRRRAPTGIVFRAQLEALARRLVGARRPAHATTRAGHDAFLAEPDTIGAPLATALTRPELP